MNTQTQTEQEQVILTVRSALSALRLTRCQDSDLRAARMKLNDWLMENDPNWQASA
jgi:hypothetical protein